MMEILEVGQHLPSREHSFEANHLAGQRGNIKVERVALGLVTDSRAGDATNEKERPFEFRLIFHLW